MKSLARFVLLLLCVACLTAIGKLDPFVDVSERAGITAAHRGNWQLFDDDFASGYLGIGQAWGDINRDAIGSRVYLRTESGNKLMQEVKCGSSLGAGNDTALHFGLGDDALRELRVLWSNGAEDVLRDVAANQFLTVSYSG